MKQLNDLGLNLKLDFETMKEESGGCSCHINPPCGYCLHPGNPDNLEESPDCWEEVPETKPPFICTRIIQFEGNEEAVLKQLGNSLPDGVKVVGNLKIKLLTIGNKSILEAYKSLEESCNLDSDHLSRQSLTS